MVIVPGFAGANDLHFCMIDVDRDWRDVERFSVRLTYVDSGAARDFDLVQLREGRCPLDRLELPYAGRWSAAVTLVPAEVREGVFVCEFVLAHR